MESAIKDLFNGIQPDPSIGQPPEILEIYSVRPETVKATASLRMDQTNNLTVQWVPGTNLVLIMSDSVDIANGSGPEETAIAMTLDGKTTELQRARQGMYLDLKASKIAHSFAIIRQGSIQAGLGANDVTFYGQDGKVSRTIPLPNNLLRSFWGTDGRFYVQTRYRIPKTKVFQTNLSVLDRASGQLTKVTVGVPEESAPQAKGLNVNTVDYRPSSETSKLSSSRGIVLASTFTSPHQFALVTPNGDQATISPRGDYVAYVSDGIAVVRPLFHMPKEVYLSALEASKRTVAISNAKQVATGLIIYASDYDDNYPSNKGDWKSKLEPYLKNNSLMQDFVYVFGGGSMATIASPATTILGYIEGPGGRAVAYTDGHVKWIPNP